MSTSRLVRSLLVAAGICIWAGSGPGTAVRGQEPAPTPPPAPQGPTFRTDASFVLTDVFVTADGKPVTDLTQADFEVKEDGVVQTVRSFESVRHDLHPTVGAPRRNPSTVAESDGDGRGSPPPRVRRVPRYVPRRSRWKRCGCASS